MGINKWVSIDYFIHEDDINVHLCPYISNFFNFFSYAQKPFIPFCLFAPFCRSDHLRHLRISVVRVEIDGHLCPCDCIKKQLRRDYFVLPNITNLCPLLPFYYLFNTICTSVVASSKVLLPAGGGYPHKTTREQRAGMRVVA